MHRIALVTLLAASGALAGCMTTADRQMAAAERCGTYGYVDINDDGMITGTEWNTYRTSAYSGWDTNTDGRISRAEFDRCYAAGGFYRDAYYNASYAPNYWTEFDANRDGYLSSGEYWSAQAWTRIDRNNNGRIDANEWVWWPG